MSTRKNKINKPNRFRSKSLRKLRKYRRGGDGPILDPFRPDASESKIIPTPFRTGFPNIYNPPSQTINVPEIIDGDKDTNFLELLRNDWNNTFGSTTDSDQDSIQSDQDSTQSDQDSTQSDQDSTQSIEDSTESIDQDAGIDQIDQYETADLLPPRPSITSPSSIAPSSIEIKSDIQPELLLKDIKELVFETNDSEHLNKNKINVESITDDQLINRLSKPPEIINNIPIINEDIEQEILQSIGLIDENEGESYVQPETPSETTSEIPPETPTETPTETTPEKPTETTPEKPTETPTETTTETTPEKPTETTTETTTEKPTETPTETPAPTPISTTPIDIPINVPVTVTTTIATPTTPSTSETKKEETSETKKEETSETKKEETSSTSTSTQEQTYGPQLKPINFPEGQSDIPQQKSEVNLPAINFPIENNTDTTPKSGGYKKKRTLKKSFY
jgi:hypothetical protein